VHTVEFLGSGGGFYSANLSELGMARTRVDKCPEFGQSPTQVKSIVNLKYCCFDCRNISTNAKVCFHYLQVLMREKGKLKKHA
jgi:hypothetical protein